MIPSQYQFNSRSRGNGLIEKAIASRADSHSRLARHDTRRRNKQALSLSCFVAQAKGKAVHVVTGLHPPMQMWGASCTQIANKPLRRRAPLWRACCVCIRWVDVCTRKGFFCQQARQSLCHGIIMV